MSTDNVQLIMINLTSYVQHGIIRLENKKEGVNMIKFKLKDTLKKYEISGNKLSVESKIRSNTIYDLLNSKAPSITFETLTSIISTLRQLTNDDSIDVSNVFVYQDKTE